MKKLLTILILLVSVHSFAQDGVFGRVIAKQSLFVKDNWVDSLRRDTMNWVNDFRTLPTTGSVYKFLLGRIPTGAGTGSVTSISQAYGIINTPNPITTSGSVKFDSATVFPQLRATIPANTDSLFGVQDSLATDNRYFNLTSSYSFMLGGGDADNYFKYEPIESGKLSHFSKSGTFVSTIQNAAGNGFSVQSYRTDVSGSGGLISTYNDGSYLEYSNPDNITGLLNDYNYTLNTGNTLLAATKSNSHTGININRFWGINIGRSPGVGSAQLRGIRVDTSLQIYFDSIARVTSTTWVNAFDSATGKVTYIRASDLTGGSSGLIVGTTTITSGTDKYALYNNGGVLGNYAGLQIGNTNNNVLMTAQATTDVPLNIKGASSQTANLLNISSSSGTGDLASIDKNGYGQFSRVGVGIAPDRPLYITTATSYGPTSSHGVIFESTSGLYMSALISAGFGANMTLYGGDVNDRQWNFTTDANQGPGLRITNGTGNLAMIFQNNSGNPFVGIAVDPARKLHVFENNSTTNAVTYIQRNTLNSTGTVANGFGGGTEWQLENASGTNRIAATEEIIYTDAVNATEDADYVFKTIRSGTLTEAARFLSTGGITLNGLINKRQGADIPSSVGAITLGTDGNSFEITGTNAITLISNLNWQNGSEITLIFTSTASLTDGVANSGTNIGFELAGGTNFTGSADDTITLILSEMGGTQRWREKCRSVN